MSVTGPFERYPGAPAGETSAFRVISPLRDAVAWVSIASRLALTTYLLRTGSGWREVLPLPPPEDASGRLWDLRHRDPVEITLQTLADDPVIASVTLSATSCIIRLVPATSSHQLGCLVTLPATAILTSAAGETVIEIPAS